MMASRLEMWEVKEILHQFPKTERVLDVGTGDGKFLDTLNENGISTAVGIEPMSDLVDTGRRMGRIIHQAYYDVDNIHCLNGEQFDVICFRESLYYMRSLVNTFTLLRKMLLRSGGLYIKCHSVNSIYYQQHKHTSIRHGEDVCIYPTMKGVKDLLNQEGYKVLKSGFFLFDVLKTLSLPQAGYAGWALSPLFNLMGKGDKFFILATRGGKE